MRRHPHVRQSFCSTRLPASFPLFAQTLRLIKNMHRVHVGDHDDRVVPLHTHKLLATLQHAIARAPGSGQRNPLVAHVEVRAGHGAGKPTEKIISEAADIYSFAAEVIGAAWSG
jgi:hypothetical protein